MSASEFKKTPPVIGIVGWKNSGKTHLVERLIKALTARGLNVSTLKHAHHAFDIDHKGRDSYRHRRAGARQVMVVSQNRWALMDEVSETHAQPDLPALLAKLDRVDLVILEGFKTAPFAKIECHREPHSGGDTDKNPLLATRDETIIAIATDTKITAPPCEVLDLNDTDSLCDFIVRNFKLADTKKTVRKKKSTMPKGVKWIAVAEALNEMHGRLTCTLPREKIPTEAAGGRILASEVCATQSNPPFANAAVDGYGFAHASLSKKEQTTLALIAPRATAGKHLDAPVPKNSAIAILTGAPLPKGVDCVVLQEETTLDKKQGTISFPSKIKPRANTRAAGEDVKGGAMLLPKGHRLEAQDLALLCATGVAHMSVYRRLRIGVLSTGNEVTPLGSDLKDGQIYDANQPMLLDILRRWGYEAVALGTIPDSSAAVAEALNTAAKKMDAIITTGGVSASAEDYVSATLAAQGKMHSWRIAIKPGRPMAIAEWQGTPVFALPGNPVASFVCALIFARPALGVLSGRGWLSPKGFLLPARFNKTKASGRREIHRARMVTDAAGQAWVETFSHEGSGRISGLSWAQGLVELSDEAQDIRIGDKVMFYPFQMFDL